MATSIQLVTTRISFCVLFLFIFSFSKAQTTEKKYFDDRDRVYSTSEKKASFVETTTKNLDGTRTLTLVKVKDGQIIRQETYREMEPIGKWTLLKDKEKYPVVLDYDFTAVYGDPKAKRPDSASFVKFEKGVLPTLDNDSIGYKAPKLTSGEQSLAVFVQKNIVYPFQAITKEIQGTVLVRFVVSNTGTIEDVEVIRGINPLLDKEAVRIVNLIKFVGPATVRGVNKKLLLVLPISFRLAY